jgi:3D (Asp-Asp-Asp) domain-containing protein
MVSATKSFFLFLSLAFVTSAAHAAAIDDLPPNLKKVGDLRPTFYWVALEINDGQAKGNALLDVDGNVLAKVSNKVLASLRLEGTGKLLDGRIINFKARVGNEIRWRICGPDAPYGYGLLDYALKPFHSVAVDPNVIPIPSRVYIPAAKGAVLPDGTIHDGYFEAVDIGDAIQNQRVDVFTSYGDQSALFEHHGFTNMTATAVYRVME